MCRFFSFVTEPEKHGGQRFYSREPLSTRVSDDDSHSVLCTANSLREDICNKYEYNPFTKEFIIDQINSEVDDSLQAQEWVSNFDFQKDIMDFNIADMPPKPRRKDIKVGDTLVFYPLGYLKGKDKVGQIACGWNDAGYMDYLAETEFVVDRSCFQNMYNPEIVKKIDGWNISLDMVYKKEDK